MSILHPIRSPNAQSQRNLIPNFPIMKRPPLPAALLTAKPAHDLLPARMTAQILRHVEHGVVDDYPKPAAAFAVVLRHFRAVDEREARFIELLVLEGICLRGFRYC